MVNDLPIKAAFFFLVLVSTALIFASGEAEAASNRSYTWQHYDRLGVEAYKDKKYSDSEEYYKRALKRSPNNVNVMNNLALCLYKLERMEESVQRSKRVIQLTENKKTQANAYYNMGRGLEVLSRSEEALLAFEKANTLHTTSSRLAAVKRINLLIHTKKYAFTPKILDSISEIFNRHSLGFVETEREGENKRLFELTKAIYKALGENNGEISHVQPVVFGVDKDHPEFDKYNECKSSQGAATQYTFLIRSLPKL